MQIQGNLRADRNKVYDLVSSATHRLFGAIPPALHPAAPGTFLATCAHGCAVLLPRLGGLFGLGRVCWTGGFLWSGRKPNLACESR